MLKIHRCRHCGRLTKAKSELCPTCFHISSLDVSRESGLSDEMHKRMLDAVNREDPEPLL